MSEDSVERRGASWMSTPTPWPSPWPKLSPKPASSITSRAIRSASTPVMPGRIARPQRAAPRGRRRTRGAAGGQRTGSERPRAVGAVAVEVRAPVGDDERLRLDERSPGSACGCAPFAPGRIAGSKPSWSAPCACSSGPQPPRELALAAADPRLRRERLERAVGGTRRTADLLDLAVVLHRAQRLDDAASSARARARPSRAPRPAKTAARRPRTDAPSSRSARSRISERFASSASTPATPGPPRCSGSP